MLLTMFKRELVLRPNCLLTRRPIYLLTGPRSIFYYRSPWKALHNFLYQHGYKASVFKLPFQSLTQRHDYLMAMKDKLNQSHIFCDRTTYEQLSDILKQTKNTTVTVLTASPLNLLAPQTYQIVMDDRAFSFSYAIHQAYLKLRKIKTPKAIEVGLNMCPENYDMILDHCVNLAEMDFYDVDLNIQS